MTNLKDKCYVCDVPLGESSNKLFVEGQWIHYKCAFRISADKISGEKEKNSGN